MDLSMSIAAMSVGQASLQVQQQIDMSVMKMAMDSSAEVLELIDASSVSLDPNLGTQLDIAV